MTPTENCRVGREDSDSHDLVAIAALRILLTEPLVRVGGLRALRDHLARMAKN